MDVQPFHALVGRYAEMLGIPVPKIRLTDDEHGPFYEPLRHRLNMDRKTLTLGDEAVCAITAHEMGHARQRKSLLREFSLTMSSLALATAAPICAASMCPFGWKSRWLLGGVLVLLSLKAYKAFWIPRVDQSLLARELDADAVSASLCGAAATLAALEATIADWGPIEFQDERREALQAAVEKDE